MEKWGERVRQIKAAAAGRRCKRREIRRDKERDYESQPEVPTWVSDIIAECQHFCQL